MLLQSADAIAGAQYYYDQEQSEAGEWVSKKVPLTDATRHKVIDHNPKVRLGSLEDKRSHPTNLHDRIDSRH